MQENKKLVSLMNIMCVKRNKAIFYVFVNIRSKNTQFYKDEIFISQNPKKKRKIKNIVFFSPKLFYPPCYMFRCMKKHLQVLHVFYDSYFFFIE
jgi:hypothetical protein